jgi:hypothetical protein
VEIFKLEAFVEDKNLGRAKRALAGLVMELKDSPVVNATRTNGKLASATNGELVRMFARYLAERKIAKIKAFDAKEFLHSVGKAESSCSYLLKKAAEYHLLKQVGKGSGTSYIVQLGKSQLGARKAGK